MKHEDRHALGIWLIAAFLGGFALYAWIGDVLRKSDEPERQLPVEISDTASPTASKFRGPESDP